MLLHGLLTKMKMLNLKLIVLFTTNTEGTVHLVNDVIPVKSLRLNPITTIEKYK